MKKRNLILIIALVIGAVFVLSATVSLAKDMTAKDFLNSTQPTNSTTQYVMEETGIIKI